MMNFLIDSISNEDDVIQIQSRSMSDPLLSDIDFKNKMAWVRTTSVFTSFWNEYDFKSEEN